MPVRLGLGIPTTIGPPTAPELSRWCLEAEQRGASTLSCIDRLNYPSLDALLALAAAAAVTRRVRLLASVVVAPLRGNGELLRKQIINLDQFSGGRFDVGLGVGRRADDYVCSDVEFETRGKQFDAQLDRFFRLPEPDRTPDLPCILFGGQGPATLRRIARWGGGWISAAGLGGLRSAIAFARQVQDAWAGADRPGNPRLIALAYGAVGERAADHARTHIHQYYGFLGAEGVERIVDQVIIGHEQLADARGRLTDAGFDELIVLPTSSSLDQLALLDGCAEHG
ncbi:Flavin-dependent oxidoreductase, luciferase family (includes alkanesulfonate monooxygenase SsuD and methylene tetrahydromethanopterin reductase) [Pseudonocardia thermophila]|uniref:Flavin-dependent oxidoreductase, luciferase family (Includes alkanesulfonate monooxygenase SsuD and methylene tetrahydromethanopterin reductase) n=1 Tax=Pseudonocardia thermophila TaxID=1848 RepID=A0A1M6XLD0_PSETH|nr:LLM class flavin-dependent oxidoreductase [Pseudonocardia thermophila]SHL06659.1 Flavin-dependent oxidoreductase, luciferase family (includes alkanesulfonate monooxygenase SsuD and methylene tetrahydromethanopterin reductase) [Pseudonocardia thermophila]